jgi:endonuclease/exonuclease/phosphatase family metal-dependent hydrolase
MKLTVVTLNIWNRSGEWERRRELISAGLARLAPDVIALQEVLASAGATQAHEVAPPGFAVAYGAGWHIGGGVHLGNAILSRHPLRDVTVFPLAVAPGEPGRCLLHAVADTPAGALPIWATHLDWRFHLGPVRLAQCQAIADHVLAGPQTLPPLLLGDFNAEPDSDEIRFLGGKHYPGGRSVYFADCFASSGTGDGTTFSRRNPYARAPVREPDRRIDYIFVKGPDRDGRGDPLAARVVFDEPSDDGVWPSDHFGVCAEIAY